MREGDHDTILFRTEMVRLQEAEPFVPFDIVLTSGDALVIQHSVELVLGSEVLEVMYSRPEMTVIARVNQVVMIRVPSQPR